MFMQAVKVEKFKKRLIKGIFNSSILTGCYGHAWPYTFVSSMMFFVYQSTADTSYKGKVELSCVHPMIL